MQKQMPAPGNIHTQNDMSIHASIILNPRSCHVERNRSIYSDAMVLAEKWLSVAIDAEVLYSSAGGLKQDHVSQVSLGPCFIQIRMECEAFWLDGRAITTTLAFPKPLLKECFSAYPSAAVLAVQKIFSASYASKRVR